MKIPKISPIVFNRIKSQACIRNKSKGKDIPEFEVIHHEEHELKGLNLLPPVSPLDVFFDIAGLPKGHKCPSTKN